MPFGTKKKTEDEKAKKEIEKLKKENEKEKKKKKSNKVSSQLNPYCSKCPHRPSQSLTPEDPRRYQKEKNYKKLYKIK